LGQALLAEIEQACERIREYPQLGAPYKQSGLRRLIFQRFPFALYYLESAAAAWIIAIAHLKRRPDYWRRRRIG
jgi:toxin ParE1/3/4